MKSKVKKIVEKIAKKDEPKVARKTVVKESHASDQTTTVPGIQAEKAPKFGKAKFHE